MARGGQRPSSGAGCIPEMSRSCIKRSGIDAGKQAGLTTSDRTRPKVRKCENCESKHSNEILDKAAAFSCPRGARAAT